MGKVRIFWGEVLCFKSTEEEFTGYADRTVRVFTCCPCR